MKIIKCKKCGLKFESLDDVFYAKRIEYIYYLYFDKNRNIKLGRCDDKTTDKFFYCGNCLKRIPEFKSLKDVKKYFKEILKCL